ncbi:MAG: ribulose-phosphate 3-epimerase [Chitinispirillaceae bacterium]|jgi:ribulose-phosphate 3-epimerase|nr:ribulose-phosphate 3-epimerase [Chitinispirillaceae bacterium]
MKNRRILVSPSILSADFRSIESEVKAVEAAGAEYIHCDVMDGHFVPNLTFGPFVIEAVKKCVSIPLDVHLMIDNAEKYIDDYCNAGASILTVHAEAVDDLRPTLNKIRDHKVKSGVTVNPDKPVSLFIDHLDLINQVLIMSVFAGFAGQKFMPEVLDKVKEVYKAAKIRGLPIDIEIDGGINETTAFECAKAGVNVFVAGSFIFGKPDYAAQITAIKNAAAQGMKELGK